MAKDKTETGFRILFDDASGVPFDMSGDLIIGSIQGGGKVLDQIDMTGVKNSIRNFLRGHANAPITARLHMNDAADGAFSNLVEASGKVRTLSLHYGARGVAPIPGDPEWFGEYLFQGFNTAPDSGRFIMDASWAPGIGNDDPAWGTIGDSEAARYLDMINPGPLVQRVTLQYSSATIRYVWTPIDGGLYWARWKLSLESSGFWLVRELLIYRLLDGVADTDGVISYSAGWTHNANSLALNNTQSFHDNTAGRSLQFTVTGAKRIYIAASKATYTVYATVTINGGSALVNGVNTETVGADKVINTYAASGSANNWFEIANGLNPAASYTVVLTKNGTTPPGSSGTNFIFEGFGVPCIAYSNANFTLVRDTVLNTTLVAGADWGYTHSYKPTGATLFEHTGSAHYNEAISTISFEDSAGAAVTVSVGTPIADVEILKLVQVGYSRHSETGSTNHANVSTTMQFDALGMLQNRDIGWLSNAVVQLGYIGMMPADNTMNRGTVAGDGRQTYDLGLDTDVDNGKIGSRLAIMWATTHSFVMSCEIASAENAFNWRFTSMKTYIDNYVGGTNKIYFNFVTAEITVSPIIGDTWSASWRYRVDYVPGFAP